MILTATVTGFWVVGLKIDDTQKTYTSFSFTLPFPYFRTSNSDYWSQVVDHIYKINDCDSSSTDLLISTEDESLLKTNLSKYSGRISEELLDLKLPVVYVGESKGFVDGIVYPLIVNPSDFYRWFSLADDLNQVENHFYNRAIYGVKEPHSNWEKGFEESLYREKLTFLFENIQTSFLSKTKNVILTGEGLQYMRDEKKVLLSYLDSLKSNGFWRIYYDKNLTLLNLHLYKNYNPEKGEEIYKSYKLDDLGGCLVVQDGIRAELKFTDGTLLKVNLHEDSLNVVPLNKETKVDVKVFYKNKKEEYFTVDGGEYGLVIDNRLRPLLKDKNSKQRDALVLKWLKEISSTVVFDEEGIKKDNSEEALSIDLGNKAAVPEPKPAPENPTKVAEPKPENSTTKSLGSITKENDIEISEHSSTDEKNSDDLEKNVAKLLKDESASPLKDISKVKPATTTKKEISDSKEKVDGAIKKDTELPKEAEKTISDKKEESTEPLKPKKEALFPKFPEGHLLPKLAEKETKKKGDIKK